MALDAPVVAVAWQAALAKANHLTLGWQYHAALFLATWAVYLIDRSSSAGEVTGLRHDFCRRNRRWIWGIVIPLQITAGIALAAYRLPSGLMWSALALGLVALLYLWLFAASPRSMAGSVFFSLTSVACMLLVGTYPISTVYRLLISVLIVVVMTCAVTDRLSARYKVVMGKPLLSSLLFVCGVASSLHFWRLDGEPLFGPDLMLLWGLAMMNLAVIAKSELMTSEHAGQALDSEASLQRSSLASMLNPVGTLLICYTAYSLTIADRPTLPAGYYTMAGLSAAALLVLDSSRRSWRADTTHAVADLMLLLPAVGYLLSGLQTG